MLSPQRWVDRPVCQRPCLPSVATRWGWHQSVRLPGSSWRPQSEQVPWSLQELETVPHSACPSKMRRRNPKDLARTVCLHSLLASGLQWAHAWSWTAPCARPCENCWTGTVPCALAATWPGKPDCPCGARVGSEAGWRHHILLFLASRGALWDPGLPMPWRKFRPSARVCGGSAGLRFHAFSKLHPCRVSSWTSRHRPSNSGSSTLSTHRRHCLANAPCERRAVKSP